jgi:cbb3-type cytochrome oxidase subunit 1
MNTLGKISPHAPSVQLPLQFVLTGILALFTGVGFLVACPDLLTTYHYNQYVIAVTHLFVLGWISSVIMGAMYQLVPVALETKLHSENIARRQFWLHLIGVTGMVWTFWIWDMKQVGHFGSLFAVGVGLFVYNIARTLRKVPRWNIVAVSIAASLFWLSFGVLAGLYVACAKCWSFSLFDAIAQMHAHAHLGILGFFIQMLIGVSYKLVPMFALSELQSKRRAGWSIALLNVGLLGAFVSILLQSPWKLAFTFLTVAGLAVYGIEIIAILRARKRKALDWGLKYFLTALSLFVPLSLLAIVLSWPALPLNEFTGQLENLYGFIALLGVVSFAILGMLYKVVPFLIWYGSYSREIGRSKVPALADLYSPNLQAIGYWTYLAGFLLMSAGIVMSSENIVRCGALIFASSLSVFALNVAKILVHLFRPKIEPLPMRAASGGIA